MAIGWSSGTKNLPDWFLTIADLLNVGFDRLSVVQFEGQLIHNMNMNTWQLWPVMKWVTVQKEANFINHMPYTTEREQRGIS